MRHSLGAQQSSTGERTSTNLFRRRVASVLYRRCFDGRWSTICACISSLVVSRRSTSRNSSRSSRESRRWPWPLPREAGRNRTKVIITHVIQRTRTENRFSVDAPPQFQADTVAFTLDDSCATLESQRSVAFPSVLFV